MKTRVDSALVSRGIAASREKAQALIMAGQIYIGEKKVLKASETVEDNQELILRGEVDSLASRGGHKIERAITVFGADVTGVVAMDIGAAAGGFDHFGNVAVDVEIGRGGVELVRFKPDSFGRRGVVVLAVDCVAHADYLPLAFGNEPLYGVVRADFPLDENYFLGVYHRFCWNFRGVV